MIHVDVKRQPHKDYPHITQFLVQTSTDGAGWRTHYIIEPDYMFEPDRKLAENRAKNEAENIARHMGTAWTYAGIQWRGTSGGYQL